MHAYTVPGVGPTDCFPSETDCHHPAHAGYCWEPGGPIPTREAPRSVVLGRTRVPDDPYRPERTRTPRRERIRHRQTRGDRRQVHARLSAARYGLDVDDVD